jgi:hypothetical protein
MATAFPRSFPNINRMPPTANEIKNSSSLKSKNSCGYDKISTKLLDTCTHYISVPLSYFHNQSMAARTFLE